MTRCRQHREFIVPLCLCKHKTQMPLFFIPQNADFPTFLSLHHIRHHLENISIFYWHLLNLVANTYS